MPLTIGQLAMRAGVNIETVRYYERRGLLPRPPRTRAGYRQFADDTVSRLRFIKRAQALGFALEDIRDLLELRLHRASAAACRQVAGKAQAKLDLVERKITDLTRMKQGLERLVASCHAREPTNHCPILEALVIETGEELGNRA